MTSEIVVYSMEISKMCLIVCPLVFFAGFIDAIAGGGGLISTPAFMMTGLPMHNVLGCNKFMSTCGTSVAAARYIKSGKINWKAALISSVASFAGAGIGSQIALRIASDTLKKGVVIVLPFIAIFVLFNKGPKQDTQKLMGTKMYLACIALGVVIGIYDGIIGPGTGTFLIFGFTSLIGFDYITSSGSAKIVNLASNVAALVSFAIAGKIILGLAIPAAISNMIGGYIGSGFAIKKGNDFIKKTLIFVLIGVFIKLVIDVF